MKHESERMKQFFSCCLLVVISLGLAASAVAQEFRGSVSGRVLDPSGAAVPGAQVTVTNTATNVSNLVTTNEDGNYTVSFVPDFKATLTNCPQGMPRTTIKGSTVDATFDTSCFYFHDAAVQTNGLTILSSSAPTSESDCRITYAPSPRVSLRSAVNR